MSFDDIDSTFGTKNCDQGYEKLKARMDGGDRSVEVLWRMAQFCHERAACLPKAQRLPVINEGLKYAEEAGKKDPNHFKAIKWQAVLTGQSTDFMPIKQKLETSKKFKELLDKAIAKEPKDSAMLHLRGRYKYSIASLSWIEKKLAATFYSHPLTATYQEALEDFLAAYAVSPKWIENDVFMAKCYVAMKDKASAKKYLTEMIEIEAFSDAEQEFLEEGRQMLAKL
uniref:Regulator of microtubule dynamics protein 1 n=1 Tax=Caenorhabditis japonica TaxID=281687 RepID=A0A8R1I2C3_CAEJA